MARSGMVRVTWNRASASLEVFSEPRTERNRRQWSVMNEQDDVDEDNDPFPVTPAPLPLAEAAVEVVAVVEAAAGGCLDDRSEPLSLLLALVPLPSRATPSSSSSSS